MRGAVLHAPGDVRCEHRADPVIIEPTDAIVRTVATCVCGSDLWPCRGIDQVTLASAIGHEYCGIVEQIGDAVALVQPGQFVIGGFLASDNTCLNCPAGVHSSCLQGTGYDGCQSELIRVPLADGTPVPTPELPAKDLVPNLLTLSDVMATGRHAAVSAGVKHGMNVAVVGDGAVGLSGVLATAQLGAERVIAMSHRRLGRRSSRRGTPDAGPVLAERRGTRRRGTGAALSAGPAGSRPEPHDRPGKGVWSCVWTSTGLVALRRSSDER
jgi:threonine dehydrogenase-like Zn-dependent dehydrogenase